MSYNYTTQGGKTRVATTVLSSKGQLVLPVSVRTEAGLHPGDRFSVQSLADGRILLQRLPPDPLMALRGAYQGEESLTAALLAERRREFA